MGIKEPGYISHQGVRTHQESMGLGIWQRTPLEILRINQPGVIRNQRSWSNESVSLDIFGICCAFAINEPSASIHLESTSLGDDTTQGHCTTTTRRRRSQNSSRRARARPITRCLVGVREILMGYLLSGCSDCLESSLSSSCACAWCHAPPPPYV